VNTNSYVNYECFHARLNASFGKAHPRIFVLIRILLGIWSEIILELGNIAGLKISKKNKKMIFFTSG